MPLETNPERNLLEAANAAKKHFEQNRKKFQPSSYPFCSFSTDSTVFGHRNGGISYFWNQTLTIHEAVGFLGNHAIIGATDKKQACELLLIGYFIADETGTVRWVGARLEL